MSVRVGDRKDGKITAINAARLLIEYTYDRVHDKTMPKSDRWLMSKSIWDDANMDRSKLIRGNSIKVENQEEATERLLLLKESIGHIDSLCANIDVMHIKGIISDNRADYWTGYYQVKRMQRHYAKLERMLRNGNNSGTVIKNGT